MKLIKIGGIMKVNVLVVEDEPEIADLVEVYLKNEGYEVHKFYNGTEAFNYLEHNTVDIAVLDVMLPDFDGLDLCQKIRKKYLFPIIMLTAKSGDIDKIMGLTVGADDYITKPFNPLELVARVKTQLRRYIQYNTTNLNQNASQAFELNGLFVNCDSRKALLYDVDLTLTPIEFNILWYLCQNKGKVVPSEVLFESIWGEKYLNNNNTVMTHIARLREKMKEPTRKPKFIKTVWGVGYTIE